MGILTSRTLWATHYRFLNDAQELDHGLSTLFNLSGEPEFQPALGWCSMKTLWSQPLSFFVTCFCETDDLLSQWRGYAAEEVGYSIGFKASGLQAHNLLRVIYDPAEQRDAFATCIRRFAQSHGGFPAHLREDLLSQLVQLAILFKHPGFSEEREWRLVIPVPTSPPSPSDLTTIWFRHQFLIPGSTSPASPSHLSAIRFRPSRRFVVPYLVLPTPVSDPGTSQLGLSISSVTVGPTAHALEAVVGVRWLLSHFGHSEVTVQISETPLRA